MWVARDKDGTLWLFEEMPQRITGDIYKDDGWWCNEDTSQNFGYCMLDSNLFPNLKWEDEPFEVQIIPQITPELKRKISETAIKEYGKASHSTDVLIECITFKALNELNNLNK